MRVRMEKNKIFFVAVSCILLLIAFVWAIKGTESNLSGEEKMLQYREILDLLIKNTQKNSFISQLESRNIPHIMTCDKNIEIIHFKIGHAEFADGSLRCWLCNDKNIKISAVQEEVLEKLKQNFASSTEIMELLGLPTLANCDENGNLIFSYLLQRDEKAKRTDGAYNAELTLLFEKNKLQDYWFSIIHDLNQKSFSEMFL